MNVAIYSRTFKVEHLPYLPDLLNKLVSLGHTVFVFEPYWKSFAKEIEHLPEVSFFQTHHDLINRADLLLSIGGDGTLLDTVHYVRDSGIPVAGINIGRLGFLADIHRDKIDQLVNAIHTHNFSIESRTFVHVDTSEDIFGEVNYGLNEMTLHKTDSASMIIIHTYLNGEFLNSFWADGLIVSTPTGSTAYSLSCGGPIVFPIANTFVLTPVAPHNLNARPIIIPNNTILSFEVETRSDSFLCSIDSRYKVVDKNFKIAIRKESFSFNLFRLPESSYINTLRQKLMWGEDVRN